jgi:hypothetical protein
MDRNERAAEIMHSNHILFERIRGVLERPSYKRKKMFDSKAVAAKASLSPVALNRTINSVASSIFPSGAYSSKHPTDNAS